MSGKKENFKFKGIEIELYGEIFVMPAMSVYAYAKANGSEKVGKIQKEINKAQKEDDAGNISAESYLVLVELIALALQRNYPNDERITKEFVGEGLDSGATMFLMQYVISQDSNVKKQMAEYAKNVQK